MGLFDKLTGADEVKKEAARARADEQQRQNKIRQGSKNINAKFAQFDDDFFADRRQSYVDFARPQLDREFGEAGEQTLFGQARSGLLDSSVAGDQRADLQTAYDINLQDVVDKARSYETDARNSVESARASLLTTLNATGDAQAASQSAINRAGALSQGPAYSPLGQLFTDFTAGISQQAALERAEAASGKDYARYNTGLFGTSPGSTRYT